MKFILIAIALCFAGCSSIRTPDGARKTSVGKDAGVELWKITGEDGTETLYLALDSNESAAFRELAKTIRSGIRVGGIKSVSSDGFDYLKSRDTTDADLQALETTTGAATEQATINAATEQAALEAATP